MAKKRMYSFAKEKHSGKGILSTILGTLSLVIFAVLAWLAYYLDGQGGVYLGSIGLLGMVFAVSSVVFRTDGIWRKTMCATCFRRLGRSSAASWWHCGYL